MTDHIPRTIRLPVDLADKLLAEAQRRRISQNAVIIEALRDRYAPRPQPTPPGKAGDDDTMEF